MLGLCAMQSARLRPGPPRGLGLAGLHHSAESVHIPCLVDCVEAGDQGQANEDRDDQLARAQGRVLSAMGVHVADGSGKDHQLRRVQVGPWGATAWLAMLAQCCQRLAGQRMAPVSRRERHCNPTVEWGPPSVRQKQSATRQCRSPSSPPAQAWIHLALSRKLSYFLQCGQR